MSFDLRRDVGRTGDVIEACSDGECGHLLALTMLPKMGPRRLRHLIDRWGPCLAWQRIRSRQPLQVTVPGEVLNDWYDASALVDPAETRDQHWRAKVQWAMRADSGYPQRLVNDPEPPEILFWRGTQQALAQPTVGIVGTRRCTRYGRDVAFELGAALGQAGVGVVSGLAIGIDAAAHAGTLQHGGVPIAVVGGGADVVYPRRNAGLWTDVVAHGLLVTEQAMGIAPQRWMFPARNRIIAGLSDVVVVVESPATGGSMYTVDAALERDRPVFAVPGPIRSVASVGTNRLLADGAHPYCSPSDVLEALGLITPGLPPGCMSEEITRDAVGAQTDRTGAKVLDALGWQSQTVDRLAARTGLSASLIAGQLQLLMAAGHVVSRDGWYERTSVKDRR